MKKIMSLFLLFQCFVVHGTWFVSQLVNESDLIFDQGARITHTGDYVEIQSISKKIKKTEGIGITDFYQHEAFGTVGGCTVIAHDPQGKKLLFSFLADPTHRVANGRASYADTHLRIAAGLHNKGMMARVVLEKDLGKEVIGYYCGYQEDNQPFKLVVQGKDGDYTALLVPVSL